MAWNESGNGKNPWDRGGSEGPPDLDKIVRDWQKRFNSLFGGGGGGGRRPRDGASGAMVVGLAVLILIGWAATGLYRVNEAERGVVLRFGKYQATTQPGNITEITPFSQQTRMLTADENIVVVDMVVQFQKADAVAFLFNVRDPDGTLRDVSESVIREVVGKNGVDFVLLQGRAEIAVQTQELIQEALDEYGAGIIVTKVNLQDTNFPSQVEAAVQDAIKAREDKERLAFEAQSYANDVVPKARGEAARRKQDAEAYKARVIADAEGEAARFEKLLTEYEKAPEVTRQRLYIEAIEDVYANSSKVLLDAGGSGNLIYLPIDKLMEQRSGGVGPGAGSRGGASSIVEPDQAGIARRQSEDLRTRRVR
jgi:membrane protease subunit HflK